MKRIISGIVSFIVLLGMFVLPTSAAVDSESLVPSNYSLVMMEGSMIGINNGELERLTCTPIEKEGTLLLPLRYFFSTLGYEVVYNNGVCEIVKDSEKISVTQGTAGITVNDEEHTLSSICENIGGNLYIPVDICDIIKLQYKYSANKLFVIYS